MNETWETEKMRGDEEEREKGFYHEEKRASIMTSIGRLLRQALVVIEGSKGGINHNEKQRRLS